LSIILLGGKTAAFTAGITEFAPTGEILPFASSSMLNTIVRVIRIATESDWVLREQETMTVN